jgi:hypothetical protein
MTLDIALAQDDHQRMLVTPHGLGHHQCRSRMDPQKACACLIRQQTVQAFQADFVPCIACRARRSPLLEHQFCCAPLLLSTANRLPKCKALKLILQQYAMAIGRHNRKLSYTSSYTSVFIRAKRLASSALIR